MNGLHHWWKKYQVIKKVLELYMKDNKIKTVEEAIESLLETKYKRNTDTNHFV